MDTNITQQPEFPNLNNGTQLIEKQKIGVSPLEKIYTKEQGACVVLGKYRITEWFKDTINPATDETDKSAKEYLDEYLQNEPEDFMIRLVTTLLEINENKLSQ